MVSHSAPHSAHSETSTIAVPEEARHASQPKSASAAQAPHITLPEGVRDTDHDLRLTRTRTHESHDDRRPDISFPFQTTNVPLGGLTDEYRAITDTGYLPADLALRPVPSRVYRLPEALADPEKAKALKEMKLVTWKEGDPEDPRNWSNLYRWCTCFSRSLLSIISA